MYRKQLFWVLMLLAVLLLAGCAGAAPVAGVQASLGTKQQTMPSPQAETPITAAPNDGAALAPEPVLAEPAAGLPAAGLPADTTAADEPSSLTIATPVDVLQSGYVISTTSVYVAADTRAAIGSIEAGAKVIVTRSQGDRYELVYNQNGAVHAWLPAAAVSFEGPVTAEPTLAAAASATPVIAVTAKTEAATKRSASTATQSTVTASGKVVFQTSNGGAIYIMNADGRGLRQLTTGFEPVLSPDGNQVAFTRWEGAPGLYVINTDGSGERLLIGADRPRSPTWTPDGQAVVFERTVKAMICRQTPFGCLTDQELEERFGGSCQTDPRGRTLCVDDFPVTTLTYTNLTRYAMASGAIHDLPAAETASTPSHHPDQDLVLYLDENGLAVTQAAADATPQRLVQLPGLIAAAVYSPDGQWIYAARKSGDHWDIWRWAADGSQAAALTSPPLLRDHAINNVSPTVSPDGKSIVFLSDRSGEWQLWVMDADGGNQRLLAPENLAGIDFRYDGSDERMVDWGS